jgi:hypothetical protein
MKLFRRAGASHERRFLRPLARPWGRRSVVEAGRGRHRRAHDGGPAARWRAANASPVRSTARRGRPDAPVPCAPSPPRRSITSSWATTPPRTRRGRRAGLAGAEKHATCASTPSSATSLRPHGVSEIAQHGFAGAGDRGGGSFTRQPHAAVNRSRVQRPGGFTAAPPLHFVGGAAASVRTGRPIHAPRPRAARVGDAILGWDFERVIVSHGDVLESGGRERFAAAFGFLPPVSPAS